MERKREKNKKRNTKRRYGFTQVFFGMEAVCSKNADSDDERDLPAGRQRKEEKNGQ